MGFTIGEKVLCYDNDGASAYLQYKATYTVRSLTRCGTDDAVTLEEVTTYQIGNNPIEYRRYHPPFSSSRFMTITGQ